MYVIYFVGIRWKIVGFLVVFFNKVFIMNGNNMVFKCVEGIVY